MSNSVNILVAVNVADALAYIAGNPDQSNISQYVYLVDSTGAVCWLSGGPDELVTTATNGDTLIWNCVSIDPSLSVTIAKFSGNAVPNVINPEAYPQSNGTVWGGALQQLVPPASPPNQAGQYNIYLKLEGKVNCYFDPFIVSNPPY